MKWFNEPFDVLAALFIPPLLIGWMVSAFAASHKDTLLTVESGMLRFSTCTVTPGAALDKEEIYIDPKAIVMITNPDDTRKECVRIVNTTGKGISVYGTLSEVVSKRAVALGLKP